MKINFKLKIQCKTPETRHDVGAVCALHVLLARYLRNSDIISLF